MKKLYSGFEKILLTDTTSHKKKLKLILEGNNPALLHQYGLLLDDTGLVISDALNQTIRPDDDIMAILARLSLITMWVRAQNTRKMTLFIHSYIDLILSDCVTTCKKGCSACCHQDINIFSDEWKLIKENVSLSLYSMIGNTCPFLKNDICDIYDFRPITCRNHLSISPVELCSIDPRLVQNLSDMSIALLISAFLTVYDLGTIQKNFLGVGNAHFIHRESRTI